MLSTLNCWKVVPGIQVRVAKLLLFLQIYFIYDMASYLVFNRQPYGPVLLVFAIVCVEILSVTRGKGAVKALLNLDRAPGLIFIVAMISAACQGAIFGNVIDRQGVGSVEYISKELVSIFLWFLVGLYIRKLTPNKFAVIISLGFTSFFWPYVDMESFRFDYGPINFAMDRTDIDHLHFSESLVFLGYCAIGAFPKSPIIKFSLGAYFLVLLFALQGRASLLIFGALLIYLIYRSPRGRYLIPFSRFIFVPLLVGYFVGEMIDVGFFGTLLESGSSQVRVLYIQFFFLNIIEFFLFGNAGLIVDSFGTVGGYAHNVFSLIQFYGFIPFVLLCFLMLKIVRSQVFRLWSLEGNWPYFLLLYVILSVIFAKSSTFILFWLALGLFYGEIRRERFRA